MAATPAGSVNIDLSVGLVFAVLGLVGIVLAVFLKEADENYWDNVGELWSVAAIAAAVLTLVPSLRSVIGLDDKLAWRLGAAGAAFLIFWWVVFVLPTIGFGSLFQNLPFLATIAIALAAIAVWTSPGNPYHSTEASSSS